MFTKSTEFYDALYRQTGKNYPQECRIIKSLLKEYSKIELHRILDLACGTGLHLYYLKNDFYVEGLDNNPDMLNAARQRNPEAKFYWQDMVDFQTGQIYDAIICMFGSAGYVKTYDNLVLMAQSAHRHLKSGGVFLLEPWLSPENYKTGKIHALFVDEENTKIARMNISERQGNLSIIHFHYLLATPAGIEHFQERHELGLFTHEEYRKALESAGFEVHQVKAQMVREDHFVCVKQ